MIITFATLTIILLFIFKNMQKNTFYILYLCTMIASAYYCENYLNWHFIPFSKKSFMIFILFHLTLINIFTFLAYGKDKSAAKKRTWRIPEAHLHTLELLGGTIGAICGQKIFHHKNKKKSYMATFTFTIIIQLTAIFYILNKLDIINL